MLIYSSGVDFFPLTVSRYSSDHLYPQRPGATAAWATQKSHKDLGFFHAADTTVVLRARNTGDAPGITQENLMCQNQLTEQWKNIWSTHPP